MMGKVTIRQDLTLEVAVLIADVAVEFDPQYFLLKNIYEYLHMQPRLNPSQSGGFH